MLANIRFLLYNQTYTDNFICLRRSFGKMDIETDYLKYNHYRYKNPTSIPENFQKHSHNTYEIIFFEKGDAIYVIEDKRYQLNRGDLVLIRPIKYHYIELKGTSEYSRFNLAFNKYFLDEKLLKSIPESLEILNCPKGSLIADLFARMEYYENNYDEKSFIVLLRCLLTELFYNVRSAKNYLSGETAGLSPFITEAIEYINANLFTIGSIKEISDKLYVSEQYLFRQFQTQLKITPKKYINSKRLLYAQDMIRRGMKPTEVFLKCGFDSYPGFYKQYMKTFGYSPSNEKNVTVR